MFPLYLKLVGDLLFTFRLYLWEPLTLQILFHFEMFTFLLFVIQSPVNFTLMYVVTVIPGVPSQTHMGLAANCDGFNRSSASVWCFSDTFV